MVEDPTFPLCRGSRRQHGRCKFQLLSRWVRYLEDRRPWRRRRRDTQTSFPARLPTSQYDHALFCRYAAATLPFPGWTEIDPPTASTGPETSNYLRHLGSRDG